MAEDPTQAPDLQSAGVTAPESDPGAILRSLSMGSLGGMPPQAMQAMGSASPASMPQGVAPSNFPQSPVNTWAATLAGYGAGFQGKENPVVAQMQAQQALDQRNQLMMFSIQQSLNRERAAKNAQLKEIYQSFVGMENPEMKAFGVRGLVGMLKKEGHTDPAIDYIGKEMVHGNIKKDDLEGVMRLAYGAVQAKQAPEDIMALLELNFPNLGRQRLSAILSQAQNPEFARSFDIETPEDREIKAGTARVDYLLKLRKLNEDPETKFPPAHIHFDQIVEQFNNLNREKAESLRVNGPTSPVTLGIQEKMDDISRKVRVHKMWMMTEGGMGIDPLTGQPFITGGPKPPSPETITKLAEMQAHNDLGDSVISRLKTNPKIIPGNLGRLAEVEIWRGLKVSDFMGHIADKDQRRWLADAADFIGTYRMIRAGLTITNPEMRASAPTIPFEGLPSLEQLEAVQRWSTKNKAALENALITFHRLTPAQQEQLLSRDRRVDVPTPSPLTPPSAGPSPLHTKIRARRKSDGKDVNIYLAPGQELPDTYEAVK